jgi:hypothetical protein
LNKWQKNLAKSSWKLLSAIMKIIICQTFQLSNIEWKPTNSSSSILHTPSRYVRGVRGQVIIECEVYCQFQQSNNDTHLQKHISHSFCAQSAHFIFYIHEIDSQLSIQWCTIVSDAVQMVGSQWFASSWWWPQNHSGGKQRATQVVSSK